MTSRLRAALLRSAALLFLPRYCCGCGRPDAWWCRRCRSQAPISPRLAVLPGDSLVVAAAMSYADPARRLLLAHKDQQLRAATPELATWLVAALRAHPAVGRGTVLVPVPASRRSRLARGRQPLLEVLQAAAAATGLRVRRSLAWQRQPRPQKTLDRGERAANVRGAMICRTVPAGRVVVVDDVLTTGATMREALRALRLAGAAPVGGVVMCYTPAGRDADPA